MVTSTVEARRASPLWAIASILVPVLRLGFALGKITRPPGWSSDQELINSLKLLFGYQLEASEAGRVLRLNTIASKLKRPTTKIYDLFACVDWRWLNDNLRMYPSEHGCLSMEDSVLVLKATPKTLTGSNIFGVHSRRMPDPVIRELEKHGLAPAYIPPKNCIAADCPIWLVEIGPGWSFGLRVESVAEGTWFDPARYDDDQRPIAEEVLGEIHGEYTVSTKRIIAEDIIDSFLDSVAAVGHSADCLTFESGSIQHGPHGRETYFVGGGLDMIHRIHRRGAHAFLDLPRLPPSDQGKRGGSTCAAWAGPVQIGEKNCTFLLEDEKVRSSVEMGIAARMPLRSRNRPPHLRNIFRLARDDAVRMACDDPQSVRYAVAQAMAGKGDAAIKDRTPVGLLVRDYQGQVASGWCVCGENIRDDKVAQCKSIARAENHLKRMAPKGPVESTFAHLRSGGVQSTGARKRAEIHARHSLRLGADILDTRATLGR